MVSSSNLANAIFMSTATHQKSAQSSTNPRADAIALLAKADRHVLEAALAAHWQNQTYRLLKPAETGLLMLRGRIGGDGAAFNVGEATVSKAIIELPDGTRGYGQCLGRDAKKAEYAAVLDALWQIDTEEVELVVLGPVRAALADKRAREVSQTAATKVDFFTLVRGED